MVFLEGAPESVRRWVAADRSADPEADLRSVLAQDVVLDFGGHKVHGIDNVINAIGFMIPPGWLGDVEWSLQPTADPHSVVIRGIAPGGATLKSPGGPMSAIDYRFGLSFDGLINVVAPQPHHLEPQDLPPALRPGDAVDCYVLPDVEGTSIDLFDAASMGTVVVFTCNHCPFALAWHRRIQDVVLDYELRGVRVLQVNSNDPATNARDSVGVSRKRVLDGEFSGAYLVDPGQLLARRWGARRTPEVFVFDARRRVVYHGAPDADPGNESLNASWLREALEALLVEQRPLLAETPPSGCTIKWTT